MASSVRFRDAPILLTCEKRIALGDYRCGNRQVWFKQKKKLVAIVFTVLTMDMWTAWTLPNVWININLLPLDSLIAQILECQLSVCTISCLVLLNPRITTSWLHDHVCDRWRIAMFNCQEKLFSSLNLQPLELDCYCCLHTRSCWENIRVEKDRRSEIDLFSVAHQLKKLTSQPYLLLGKRQQPFNSY